MSVNKAAEMLGLKYSTAKKVHQRERRSYPRCVKPTIHSQNLATFDKTRNEQQNVFQSHQNPSPSHCLKTNGNEVIAMKDHEREFQE